MNRLMVAIAALAVAGALSGGAGLAAAQSKKGGKVAGKWMMTVAGSPHGDLKMALALKQDGQKVTGTLTTPHGDMAVEGELVDNALSLTTAGEAAITLKATLKDDGTLRGFLSSEMGDMTWTAERVREGK